MNTAKTTASTNEVVTQKGSKTSIKLPDGTRVWLNSDSKLTYAEDFSGSKREINLTGEAYFDVAHDADRPFIIHTQKMDIRVLGTAFNVKSYPQDDIVETVLIRGKIEVTFPGRLAEKIILKPNEKLILRKEPEKQNSSANEIKTNTQIPKMMVNTLEYISKDSVVAETAWLDNKLAFTNETLGNIAVELERKFDIRIDFKTEALKAYRYTGLFDQQNPEKILQLLSLSKAFKLRVEDKRIILSQ